MADYDLTIIGGGINGTAIARDAAGRGLRVLLVEQNDLSSGTSWTSSKLIHGGLRYLEQGAFALVQEGLHERALLLHMAPHIIWPTRFVLPHHKALRPAWQLRLGLFIYDLLAGKSMLPGTCTVDLTTDDAGKPLQPHLRKGFEYSDCCVDDARLVILNAVDAAEHGADIRTRTYFERAERHNQHWHITLNAKSEQSTITSRALINAAGPWIEQVNAHMPSDIPRGAVKLVKGSHIVVPRLFDHNKAYIFQNADGRIVFAIPYHHNFTLIGTTDVIVSGDPAPGAASAEEITYLCKLANDYFKKSITPSDVVWNFSGIRALYDHRSISSKDLSRDYYLALDGDADHPPLLSIYGGKLTAARHLAETALEKLAPFLPMGERWTEHSSLPGGDFPWNGFDDMVKNVCKQWGFLTPAHARRLVRAYGTRITHILGGAKAMGDLGECFGADLTAREVCYLMQHEWAQTADDILWLRTKLGLYFNLQQKEKLASFIASEQQ
ncbi:MAG: glycerol-3-phosphate dehydrogenase [Alphaproteobacteria bacterium]|nr:glycerol-3-phosphate dehydrogenase [Alphaproteobacteria bacterium]